MQQYTSVHLYNSALSVEQFKENLNIFPEFSETINQLWSMRSKDFTT